jgi:hypothetical protein
MMFAWIGNYWGGLALGVVLLVAVIIGLLWLESVKEAQKWAKREEEVEASARAAIYQGVMQRVRENERQIDFIKGNVEYLQSTSAGHGKALENLTVDVEKIELDVSSIARRLS